MTKNLRQADLYSPGIQLKTFRVTNTCLLVDINSILHIWLRAQMERKFVIFVNFDLKNEDEAHVFDF